MDKIINLTQNKQQDFFSQLDSYLYSNDALLKNYIDGEINFILDENIEDLAYKDIIQNILDNGVNFENQNSLLFLMKNKKYLNLFFDQIKNNKTFINKIVQFINKSEFTFFQLKELITILYNENIKQLPRNNQNHIIYETSNDREIYRIENIISFKLEMLDDTLTKLNLKKFYSNSDSNKEELEIQEKNIYDEYISILKSLKLSETFLADKYKNELAILNLFDKYNLNENNNELIFKFIIIEQKLDNIDVLYDFFNENQNFFENLNENDLLSFIKDLNELNHFNFFSTNLLTIYIKDQLIKDDLSLFFNEIFTKENINNKLFVLDMYNLNNILNDNDLDVKDFYNKLIDHIIDNDLDIEKLINNYTLSFQENKDKLFNDLIVIYLKKNIDNYLNELKNNELNLFSKNLENLKEDVYKSLTLIKDQEDINQFDFSLLLEIQKLDDNFLFSLKEYSYSIEDFIEIFNNFNGYKGQNIESLKLFNETLIESLSKTSFRKLSKEKQEFLENYKVGSIVIADKTINEKKIINSFNQNIFQLQEKVRKKNNLKPFDSLLDMNLYISKYFNDNDYVKTKKEKIDFIIETSKQFHSHLRINLKDFNSIFKDINKSNFKDFNQISFKFHITNITLKELKELNTILNQKTKIENFKEDLLFELNNRDFERVVLDYYLTLLKEPNDSNFNNFKEVIDTFFDIYKDSYEISVYNDYLFSNILQINESFDNEINNGLNSITSQYLVKAITYFIENKNITLENLTDIFNRIDNDILKKTLIFDLSPNNLKHIFEKSNFNDQFNFLNLIANNNFGRTINEPLINLIMEEQSFYFDTVFKDFKDKNLDPNKIIDLFLNENLEDNNTSILENNFDFIFDELFLNDKNKSFLQYKEKFFHLYIKILDQKENIKINQKVFDNINLYSFLKIYEKNKETLNNKEEIDSELKKLIIDKMQTNISLKYNDLDFLQFTLKLEIVTFKEIFDIVNNYNDDLKYQIFQDETIYTFFKKILDKNKNKNYFNDLSYLELNLYGNKENMYDIYIYDIDDPLKLNVKNTYFNIENGEIRKNSTNTFERLLEKENLTNGNIRSKGKLLNESILDENKIIVFENIDNHDAREMNQIKTFINLSYPNKIGDINPEHKKTLKMDKMIQKIINKSEIEGKEVYYLNNFIYNSELLKLTKEPIENVIINKLKLFQKTLNNLIKKLEKDNKNLENVEIIYVGNEIFTNEELLIIQDNNELLELIESNSSIFNLTDELSKSKTKTQDKLLEDFQKLSTNKKTKIQKFNLLNTVNSIEKTINSIKVNFNLDKFNKSQKEIKKELYYDVFENERILNLDDNEGLKYYEKFEDEIIINKYLNSFNDNDFFIKFFNIDNLNNFQGMYHFHEIFNNTNKLKNFKGDLNYLDNKTKLLILNRFTKILFQDKDNENSIYKKLFNLDETMETHSNAYFDVSNKLGINILNNLNIENNFDSFLLNFLKNIDTSILISADLESFNHSDVKKFIHLIENEFHDKKEEIEIIKSLPIEFLRNDLFYFATENFYNEEKLNNMIKNDSLINTLKEISNNETKNLFIFNIYLTYTDNTDDYEYSNNYIHIFQLFLNNNKLDELKYFIKESLNVLNDNKDIDIFDILRSFNMDKTTTNEKDKENLINIFKELSKELLDEKRYKEQEIIFKFLKETLENSPNEEYQKILKDSSLQLKQINVLKERFYIFEEMDNNNDNNNIKENNYVLTNQYMKKSYIDYLNDKYDTFLMKDDFLSFIESKNKKTIKLFNSLTTPINELKYFDNPDIIPEKDKKFVIMEINRLKSEYLDLVNKYETLKDKFQKTKSDKKKLKYKDEMIDVLNKFKLHIENEDFNEEIKKSINNPIDDENIFVSLNLILDSFENKIEELSNNLDKIFKGWYKDINVKLMIFNNSLLSSKYKNYTNNIDKFEIDEDLLNKQMEIFHEKKQKDITIDDFKFLKSLSTNKHFLFSMFTKMDTTNSYLVELLLNENLTIEEQFNNIKSFDNKKYRKMFNIFTNMKNSKITDINFDNTVETNLIEDFLFYSDYNKQNIEKLIKLVDNSLYTFEEFHYFNFSKEIINEVGFDNFIKFFEKMNDYLNKLTENDQLSDLENLDIMSKIIDNVDFIFSKNDNKLTGSPAYIIKILVQKSSGMDNLPNKKLQFWYNRAFYNPESRKFDSSDNNEEIDNLKSLINNDNNSMSNTVKNGFIEVLETIKKQSSNPLTNQNELKIPFLLKLDKNDNNEFQVSLTTTSHDAKSIVQGFLCSSCLIPGNAGKSLFFDMPKNPNKYFTDMVFKSFAKGDKFLEEMEILKEKIDMFNYQYLETNSYNLELLDEIDNILLHSFIANTAASGYVKNNVKVLDNAETNIKTYIDDIRVNIIDDASVNGLKDLSKITLLNSKIQILTDILNQINNQENIDIKGDVKDIKLSDLNIKDYPLYTTIGSGYTEDSILKHFKQDNSLTEYFIENRIGEDGNFVYTDACKEQQYIIQIDDKFKVDDNNVFLNYIQELLNSKNPQKTIIKEIQKYKTKIVKILDIDTKSIKLNLEKENNKEKENKNLDISLK
jgi:hypothetical protein